MLDRIDIHIEVTPVPFEEMNRQKTAEASRDIRARVIRARKRQSERYADDQGIYCNAQMQSRHLREVCRISSAGSLLLKTAHGKLELLPAL